MALEAWIVEMMEEYPQFADEIRKMQEAGINDEDINIIMNARKEGIAVPQVTSPIEAQTVTQELVDAENEQRLPVLEEAVNRDIPSPLEVEGTDVIAEMARFQRARAVGTNITATGLYALSVKASAIPFTSMGDAIDEMWRLPFISAEIYKAQDIATVEYIYAIKPQLRRHWLRKWQPMIPEPYRLALAASKELLDDETYNEFMTQNGLDSFWASVWKWQNYDYPNIETTLALRRRGLLDDSQFDVWFSQLSMPPSVRDAVKQLEDVIPPLTDLIHMAVREAFGTHLAEEQLPEYKEWASKMGLTDYFAEAYWYAHWDRIALAQMYDNLYRGFWTREQFMAMLRIKDVHPDDREAIYNVAFNPPSLREMGYGWDTGVYQEADIEKYRKWGGLSPEDAKLSARSMVAYRTEAEREAVRREYMYLYSLDKISELEFRENLERLITAPEAIELWIERGMLNRERKLKPMEPTDYRVVTSSEAKWMYMNRLRDEEWYRAKLADLDWDSERIEIAIERAVNELREIDAEPAEDEARKLTFGQISDLFRHRRIDEDEALRAYQDIGYSEHDAINLLDLIISVEVEELEPKALTRTDIDRMYDIRLISETELREAYENLGYSLPDAVALAIYTKVNNAFPDMKAMYRNNWITSKIMYDELTRLGLPAARASEFMMTIIKAEQPARVTTERDLTKTEIIKGVKAGIVTIEQGIGLLMDLGYEQWEAEYILIINKVVAVGDPEGFWDMKRVTEAYKKAMGQKNKKVPEDLLIWEQRYKTLKAESDKMRADGVEDDVLSKKMIELSDVEGAYRRLMQRWELSEE